MRKHPSLCMKQKNQKKEKSRREKSTSKEKNWELLPMFWFLHTQESVQQQQQYTRISTEEKISLQYSYSNQESVQWSTRPCNFQKIIISLSKREKDKTDPKVYNHPNL